MSITDLMTEAADALKATGVFSAVIIREDSSAVIGREPAADIEYGGMSTVSDGPVSTYEHTLYIYVRLLSIGRADMSPADTALTALRGTGAVSVTCVPDSTDSRTVTFKLTAFYRSAA